MNTGGEVEAKFWEEFAERGVARKKEDTRLERDFEDGRRRK